MKWTATVFTFMLLANPVEAATIRNLIDFKPPVVKGFPKPPPAGLHNQSSHLLLTKPYLKYYGLLNKKGVVQCAICHDVVGVRKSWKNGNPYGGGHKPPPPSEIPIAPAWFLFATGAAGVGYLSRRRSKLL